VDDCGVDGWGAGDCDSCACEGAEAAVRVRLLRNRALNLPVAALHCGSGACSTKTLVTSVASGLNSSALSGIESVSARLCGGFRSAAEGAGAAGSGSFGGGKAGCERVGDATPVTVVPRSSESRASALNTFEQRPQRTKPCATRRSAAVTTRVRAHLGQTVYMKGVVPKDRPIPRARRKEPYQSTRCKRVSPRTAAPAEGPPARQCPPA